MVDNLRMRKTGRILLTVMLVMLMTSCKTLHRGGAGAAAGMPQVRHSNVTAPASTTASQGAAGTAVDPSEVSAAGSSAVAADAAAVMDTLAQVAQAVSAQGAGQSATTPGKSTTSASKNSAAASSANSAATAAALSHYAGTVPLSTLRQNSARRSSSASRKVPAADDDADGSAAAHRRTTAQTQPSGSPVVAAEDVQKEVPADSLAADTAVQSATKDETKTFASRKLSVGPTVTNAGDIWEDDDAPETDAQKEALYMKILLILLLLLLAAFAGYVIYTRRKIAELEEEGHEAILDLRLKQQRKAEGKEEEIQREIKARVDRAVDQLKREISEAQAVSESALSEKEQALADKQLALSEKSQADADRQEALTERDKAMADKQAALDLLAQKTEALNEMEVSLASMHAQIKEKDEALAEKDAELKNRLDALASLDEKLRSKDAELQDKDAQLAELSTREAEVRSQAAALKAAAEAAAAAAAEKAAQQVAEAAAQETPEVAGDNSVEMNSMRKFLMRRIESAQAVLDLKGEKKGEVMADDEWKDIEFFLENVDHHFVSRMKERFPMLTQKDLELMMLLRLRMPSKSIASVYGINEKSIKQKLFVYKTKVGLETDPMSLRDFIENF